MNELYEKCLQQEKELVFESVTQEDMIRLGWTLYENNKKFAGPLAILIKINEKTVFSCYPDGTGAFHELWLERKANMVYMREMCTLRAFLELEIRCCELCCMWGRISVAIEKWMRSRCNMCIGIAAFAGSPGCDRRNSVIPRKRG